MGLLGQEDAREEGGMVVVVNGVNRLGGGVPRGHEPGVLPPRNSTPLPNRVVVDAVVRSVNWIYLVQDKVNLVYLIKNGRLPAYVFRFWPN